MKRIVSLLGFWVVIFLGCQQRQLEIDADFPGGNILLKKISGDTVYVEPDTSNSSTDWFYWNFKVRNAAGRNLVFQFSQPDKLTSLGPAVSNDQGKTWQWLGSPGSSDHFGFIFEDNREVQFCTAFPYTLDNWNRFIDQFRYKPEFESRIWCKTPENRALPYLSIRPEGEINNLVVFTARHHACEMMASYVLEGIISSIVAGLPQFDESEFLIIPFMDLDGVQNGDQGKNRIPRDHNRDYRGESLYCSTKSLRDYLENLEPQRNLIVFDLHNPWIRNEDNEQTFFTGIDNPSQEAELIRFAGILDSMQSGPIQFDRKNILRWGTGWYSEGIFDPGYSLQKYSSLLPQTLLSTTLEIPYALSSGDTVTAQSAHQFGSDLARALSVYLEKL